MYKFIIDEDNYLFVIDKINDYFKNDYIRKCIGIISEQTNKVETIKCDNVIFSKPIFEQKVEWTPFFGNAEIHHMQKDNKFFHFSNKPFISVSCKFENCCIPLRSGDIVIFRNDKMYLIQKPDECVNRYNSFAFKIEKFEEYEIYEHLKNKLKDYIGEEYFYFDDEFIFQNKNIAYDVIDKIFNIINVINFQENFVNKEIYLDDKNILKININTEKFKSEGLFNHVIEYEMNGKKITRLFKVIENFLNIQNDNDRHDFYNTKENF